MVGVVLRWLMPPDGEHVDHSNNPIWANFPGNTRSCKAVFSRNTSILTGFAGVVRSCVWTIHALIKAFWHISGGLALKIIKGSYTPISAGRRIPSQPGQESRVFSIKTSPMQDWQSGWPHRTLTHKNMTMLCSRPRSSNFGHCWWL